MNKVLTYIYKIQTKKKLINNVAATHTSSYKAPQWKKGLVVLSGNTP